MPRPRTYYLLSAVVLAAAAVAILLLWEPKQAPDPNLATLPTPTARPSEHIAAATQPPRPPIFQPPAFTSSSAPDAGPVASDCAANCKYPCQRTLDRRSTCPHDCSKDADCPNGSLCTYKDGRRGCFESECQSAADCGPKKTCLYVGRMEGGVSLCVPAGERKVSDSCSVGETAAELCGVGLKCVHGRCLPTTCTSDTECPQGSRCATFAGGDEVRQCVLHCKANSDCAAGETCVQVPDGPSLCTKKADTCLTTGCGPNQVCSVENAAHWDLHAVCVAKCSSDADCGPASFCFNANPTGSTVPARCYKQCDPNDPGTCPDQYRCVKNVPHERYGCAYRPRKLGEIAQGPGAGSPPPGL
jgi:hypothetical protein